MNSISLQINKTDFKGGETLNGQVDVTLVDRLPVRGIRVELKGKEFSRWSQGTGKSRKVYSETRMLFDEELTLQGEPKLGLAELLKDSVAGLFAKESYTWLEPGNYSYAFSYTLPTDLPGDYQSPGSSEIRYSVKAYVDLPLKDDLEAVEALTVYEAYRPEDVSSVAVEKSKSFLFDSSSTLLAKASLERNVFFVGETIAPILEVHNRSAKPIEAVQISLVQIENLHAYGREGREQYDAVLERFDECRVAPGAVESFQPQFLIPSDLYPSIRSGRLVRVSYELFFRLHVPWAADLRFSLPIVLLERAGAPGGKIEPSR